MRDLLVVLGMALGVYLPKALPLVLVAGEPAPWLRRWLCYVPPAVLAALVAPAVLAPGGHVAAFTWVHLGYLAAFVVALATRRMLPSLAAGLAVVLLVTLLHL
jgi:branched-subunit amino acid transport protein